MDIKYGGVKAATITNFKFFVLQPVYIYKILRLKKTI